MLVWDIFETKIPTSLASQTIDIETEVQPYMIDDLNDKVTAAVSTVGNGILDLMGQQ